MGTLKELIVASKCRRGQSKGKTKSGAFWRAADIRTRSFGGDGIGNSGASQTVDLELRHFRDGDVKALLIWSSWHQNGGADDVHCDAGAILDCTTVEGVIAVLKGIKIRDDGWHDSSTHAYSDYFEDDLTNALNELGLPTAGPAPDELPA